MNFKIQVLSVPTMGLGEGGLRLFYAHVKPQVAIVVARQTCPSRGITRENVCKGGDLCSRFQNKDQLHKYQTFLRRFILP